MWCASEQDMSRRRKAEKLEFKRVVAYIRVSTSQQADQGNSLEAQRARLETYAKDHELDIVAVEVDAGESACSLKRPALQRALKHLRQGKADGLVVTKLDRLTRSIRDLVELVDTHFQRYALLSVHEHIDTQSAAGRMLLNVLSSVSQWEREAIGERTAAVKQHLRQQGLYCGGGVPYGYRRDGGHLVEDDVEQVIVREVRRLHTAGLTLRAIAGTLTENGTVMRGGHSPSPGFVHRILTLEPLTQGTSCTTQAYIESV